MARGRPTEDPKGTLVAVRLPDRQVRLLKERARREDVALSEALRRCLDEWARTCAPERSRRPTAEERETFNQVFAILGLTPKRPPRPRPRRR